MADTDTILCDVPARLDVFLGEQTEFSRSFAKKRILDGGVTVNGKPQKPNYLLKAGDAVTITYPEPKPVDVEPEDIPLDIVYEDGDVLVVNKPQGMVVHPSPGHDSGTLVNALLFHCRELPVIGGEQRPGIVHRIDKMTSGLLVVAKNDAAHRSLSDQFRDHSANRRYLALVDGNLREDSGTIRGRIGRHPNDRKKMAITERGREAVTHWRVLQRFSTHTLLQVTLETGRTHQIRVHMASIKHPVTGDAVYGAAKVQLGLCGQALHGYRLVFRHPANGERMTLYAPPPAYFQNAVNLLDVTYDLDRMFSSLMEKTEPGKDESR